ncbi:MAG: carbamoyltransferase HypF [bacterium JZ-2024 1]
MSVTADQHRNRLRKRSEGRQRLKVVIRGAVQGVGFRPFVFRLASRHRLSGWVLNSAQGVFVEVEGVQEALDAFLCELRTNPPPRSSIQSLEASYLDPVGYETFEIRHSEDVGVKTALVLPDIATCPDCLRDIFDVRNRRFRYPFTNCTNCGPRFTIIRALPYDRPNTSMSGFRMCPECQREYEDPLDRRFHAQPNACPNCGPHLELVSPKGEVIAGRDRALMLAEDAIREGRVVALKGLGGFHLMVDARNDEAVRTLRVRKRREEKPLALMFPSVQSVRAYCEVTALEERLLLSPESPIVLLTRKPMLDADRVPLSAFIAPRNPYLGVMLPYTPLHHLLMADLAFPVVATSGNLSDEPICIDNEEALKRLGGIADLFLMHNRPIVRHVDDSIVRVVSNRELVIRRARGFAPLPITLKQEVPSLIGVGAHLKNTISASVGSLVFISQHIGDLETVESYRAFQRVIESFKTLYELRPTAIAGDLHPDYLSTKYAESTGMRVFGIQHHYAHILSCMAENEVDPPLLGVSWDGTGYGLDGTIWGGEFMRVDARGFSRVAHLRSFPLPGAERAVREPRRCALGLLYEAFPDDLGSCDDLPPWHAFSANELKVLIRMLKKGVSSPRTSSAGRLFDAVASLVGLQHISRFEGQAAMELEFAVDTRTETSGYPFRLLPRGGSSGPVIVDWQPTLDAIIQDVRFQVSPPIIARKFHDTLAEIIVAVAQAIEESKVLLSGGCFQNKYLTERTVTRLREEGFKPYWHQRIPPNDGGIALGQIVGAARIISEGVQAYVPRDSRQD